MKRIKVTLTTGQAKWLLNCLHVRWEDCCELGLDKEAKKVEQLFTTIRKQRAKQLPKES